MSRIVWLGILALVLSVLSGCDIDSVKSSTLKRFPYGSKQAEMDTAIGSGAVYTFDYLVDGHVYRYQKVHSEDIGRNFGLLFKDQVLVSMRVIREEDGFKSKLKNCALFPFPKGFDSVGCMRSFSDQFITLGSTYPPELMTPVEAAKVSDRGETAGTVVESAMVMAITYPVLVFAVPVIAAGVVFAATDNSPPSDPNKKIGIRLGQRYEDIRSFVEALPDTDRDMDGADGTFYVRNYYPGGFPGIAFGIQDGIVVWMAPTPSSNCRNGICWLVNDTTIPGDFYPKDHPEGVSYQP